MIFISHALALLFSTFCLGYFLRTIYRFVGTIEEARSTEDNNTDRQRHRRNFIKALHEEDKYQRSAALYFLFTGVITTGAFYLIQMFPKWIENGFIGEVVSIGVHVPIILMIAGIPLKLFKLSLEDKKKLLFLVTLVTSISFLFWNWRLGLLSICIVLGKYIWIDFIFDFKISDVKGYVQELWKGRSMQAIIGRYCVIYFIAFMGFQFFEWLNQALGRSKFNLILCYATPFVLLGLPLIIVRLMTKKSVKKK